MNKIEKVSMTKDQMLLIKSSNFNTKCRKMVNRKNSNCKIKSIKMKRSCHI